MTARLVGRQPVSFSRNSEGGREYTVRYIVETDDKNDGPRVVERVAGLPKLGDPYSVGNDFDQWSLRTNEIDIQHYNQDEEVKTWYVTLKYKTLSVEENGASKRCNTLEFADPLSEPPIISGSFINDVELVTRDNEGNLIKNTAHEPVQVEKQNNRPTVVISQNVANLQLSTIYNLVNKTNDAPLWGLQAGEIRFNNASWQKLYYGQCFVYFNRILEFEAKEGGFTSGPIPNLSNKFVVGLWDPNDKTNFIVTNSLPLSDPRAFMRAVDPFGNPAQYWLDSATGKPHSQETYLPEKQITEQGNFLLLGIPRSLEG